MNIMKKFPWYEFSVGGFLGFLMTIGYVVVYETITIKRDLINLDDKIENISTTLKSESYIYGKLTKIKSVYRNKKLDHYILTVTQHQFRDEDVHREQYLYLNNNLNDDKLLELIKNDYCLKFNLDLKRYPQISYKIIDNIEIVQKHC